MRNNNLPSSGMESFSPSDIGPQGIGGLYKSCGQYALEHDGITGGAAGAVTGAAAAIGISMVISAPVSVPLTAGLACLGALGGFLPKE